MSIPIINVKLTFDESNEPFFIFQSLEYQDPSLSEASPWQQFANSDYNIELERQEYEAAIRWQQFAVAHQDI